MRVLFVCLFVVNHVVVQIAQEIKGDNLARELDKVADSVGWSFLQVHILLRIQIIQVIAINKKINLNCYVLRQHFIHLFFNHLFCLNVFYLLVM